MKIDLIEFTKLTEIKKIELLYITLLGRNIDPVGKEYWESLIADEKYTYKSALDHIINSTEYLIRYTGSFLDMVHKARQAWCKGLDKYDCILDIGGSSPNASTGALIELGYSHRPKQIYILDKPAEEQYWGNPKYSQEIDYEFDWGKVEYHHCNAEDISEYEAFKNLRVDAVYMGQVIEHIHEESLPSLLHWIKDHLNDGGKFIFDTPNRILTSIQSPDEYIDDDHKIEYTPEQLEVILNDNGFTVIKKTGILNMPNSYETKVFNPQEVYTQTALSDRLETCYLFAFECVLDSV